MENRNRIYRWLSLLALTLLLTGCGQDLAIIGPGECFEIHSGAALYLALPEGKYLSLSQELCETMARGPSWAAPDGIRVEDATIRAVPSTVSWEFSNTRYSAEGAVLEARAVLCADDQLAPRSSELRVALPMMEAIGEEAADRSEGHFEEADFDISSFEMPALDDDVPEADAHEAKFVPPDTLVLAKLDLRGTIAEAKRARSRRQTFAIIGGGIVMLICVAPVLNAIFPALLKGLRGRKR
jgi:hypothetical protein